MPGRHYMTERPFSERPFSGGGAAPDPPDPPGPGVCLLVGRDRA